MRQPPSHDPAAAIAGPSTEQPDLHFHPDAPGQSVAELRCTVLWESLGEGAAPPVGTCSMHILDSNLPAQSKHCCGQPTHVHVGCHRADFREMKGQPFSTKKGGHAVLMGISIHICGQACQLISAAVQTRSC